MKVHSETATVSPSPPSFIWSRARPTAICTWYKQGLLCCAWRTRFLVVAGSELRSVFPSLAGTLLGRGTGLCCPPGQALCLTLAGRFLVWLSLCQASGQAGPVKSSASYSGKRQSCYSFVVMSIDFPHPYSRSLLSRGK